jgi:DNA recombination protein RmuC
MDVHLAAVLVGTVIGAVVGAFLGAVFGRLHAQTLWAGERARLTAAVETERMLGAERLAAAGGVAGRLEERFDVLSAQALRRISAQFLDLGEQRLEARLKQGSAALEHVVTPLRDTLGKLESQLGDSDRRGAAAQAALVREMELIRGSSEQLRDSTGALINALGKPQGGGMWGEMQLRRVVELAGMVERCDFDVQVATGTPTGWVRPDLLVRLAGGRSIVVDAKVSLSAFLEATAAADEATRDQRLAAHAKHLRAHVDALAAKEYWSAFPQCPEFVVLFIPGDGFLAAALVADPALLEHAFGRRVHILTPATLISALRTIAFEWQESALTDNARAVLDVGRELYKRLSTYAGHIDRLGRTLGAAVGHYNAAVGSLERNLLASSRRLYEFGVSDEVIPPPRAIEEPVRRISAADLLADGRIVSLPVRGAEEGVEMSTAGSDVPGAS